MAKHPKYILSVDYVLCEIDKKMPNLAVKYSIIMFLLVVYINRGVFIAPYEVENHGNRELNSVFELLVQLISGEGNDIDEDGDLPSDCNSVKIVQYDFSQQLAQQFELINLYSQKTDKFAFFIEENLPIKPFCFPIDHPPEVI